MGAARTRSTPDPSPLGRFLQPGASQSAEVSARRLPRIMARLFILMRCLPRPQPWAACTELIAERCLSLLHCVLLSPVLLQVRRGGGKNTNKVVSYSFFEAVGVQFSMWTSQGSVCACGESQKARWLVSCLGGPYHWNHHCPARALSMTVFCLRLNNKKRRRCS